MLWRGNPGVSCCAGAWERAPTPADMSDRKSTRLNSSHLGMSYAVFCLKKKNRRLTAEQIEHARDTAAKAGLPIKAQEMVTAYPDGRAIAEAAAPLQELAILAMTLGLIR